jgi:hypothetical protein
MGFGSIAAAIVCCCCSWRYSLEVARLLPALDEVVSTVKSQKSSSLSKEDSLLFPNVSAKLKAD